MIQATRTRQEKRGQMDKYEGPLGFVARAGSLGKQADAITAYRRPEGALHGPYWLTYLGGANEFNGQRGVWKVLYDETPCARAVCDGQDHGTMTRLADGDQVDEIYAALREGRIEEFIELAHTQNQIVLSGGRTYWSNGELAREGQPEWGDLPDVCEWIESHDDTIVRYTGRDAIWPEGCYSVTKFGCERQLLDPAQLMYVATEILGMPEGYTSDSDAPHKMAPKLKRQLMKAEVLAFERSGKPQFARKVTEVHLLGADDDDLLLAGFEPATESDWADYENSDPAADILNAFYQLGDERETADAGPRENDLLDGFDVV